MDQIKTLNSMETSFSMPGVNTHLTEITQEVLFRVERRNQGSGMTKAINNYLKTAEEIEAECCFAAFYNEGIVEPETRTKLKKDGYINIHSLDDILSGTMEENY